MKRPEKLDKEINSYDCVVENNSHSFQAHHKLGQVLQNQGQFQKATTSYQKAIELNPQFSRSHHNLGQCLAKQQKLEEAVAAYQKAIEIEPECSLYYHSYGDARFEMKCWDEAIALYHKAIDLNPNFAWSHYNKGRALANEGKTEEAIVAYERAIEIDPKLTQCCHDLGEALLQMKNLDKAAKCYQRLGDIHFELKKWDEAVTFYQKSIDLNPNMAQSHYNLGRILQQKGQVPKAVNCYLKAIQSQPDFSPPYLTLRNTPLNASHLDRAIECYRQVIQVQSNFPPLHINFADALTKQGKIEEATVAYKMATYQQTKIGYPELVNKDWDSENVNEPDFIIIGAEKGGTSSLYVYLMQHPQVVPPIDKEIHFFSHRFNNGKDWYLAHFAPIPPSRKLVTGEASTSYLHTCHLNTHQRLFKLLPHIKLIVILRNPVDRAISQYHQRVRLGQERRSLDEAISAELEILDGIEDPITVGEAYWKTQSGYLWVSLYVHFLKRWMSLFAKNQCLVLKSEDFNQCPERTMKQVYKFLDLPEHQLSQYEKYNAGSYPSIEDEIRRSLSDFFAPHNKSLEEYLGMKFNWE